MDGIADEQKAVADDVILDGEFGFKMWRSHMMFPIDSGYLGVGYVSSRVVCGVGGTSWGRLEVSTHGGQGCVCSRSLLVR